MKSHSKKRSQQRNHLIDGGTKQIGNSSCPQG